MKNINTDAHGISIETKKKIALVNSVNPYTDITPYELQIGFPNIKYQGFFVQSGELIIYAAPAQTFTDKNMMVGYTGKSSGVSVRVAKGVSIRSGGSGGRAIRSNVRNYNSGDLIITNKRVLFIGKDGGFEYKVDKISATKIISKTSFIIQAGRTSKNVTLNAAIVGYTLGFINYVVDEYTKGIDAFSEIEKNMGEISQKQIELCNAVRQETLGIRVPKLKNKQGCLWKIVIILFCFIAAIVVGVSVLSTVISSDEAKDINSNSNNTPAASSTTYSAIELINMSKHPLVFDNIESTRAYYDSIGDDRVAIVSIQEHYQLQNKLEHIFEDAVLIYFIQDSTDDRCVGKVQINIFQQELYENMDIDRAVEIIAAYLPKDFFKYYKLDSAYSYGNDDMTTYTYACRLNEAGIEYHNNENGEYSYYYNFKIFHYQNTNQWKLETDYAAYGNKDVGWIEKYADKWDIDIREYLEAEY